ncbi:hypothetical protein Syun_016841 [Stephania yunnanensis]|uniref:Uncharacterized protein n=1 Tax=Stephania yunnanensis TaxID=152371 RepID=A0AAP0J5Z0_9MAGN
MTISHVRSTLRASTGTTHLWNLAFLLPISFCGVGGLKSDWRLGCLPHWGASGWRPRCPHTRILNFPLALHKRRRWTNLPELLTFTPPPHPQLPPPLIQSSRGVVIVPPTNHSDIP